MPDWSKPMTQTFEYYVVDPSTWMDKTPIRTVKSCNIDRDLDSDTLMSAGIDVADSIGENYIRIYLVTIQNGVTEKHPLGTAIIQSPASSSDGKSTSTSMDAYSPLLELKENPPPLGYSLLKGDNIMKRAYQIVREQARAPVVETSNSTTLESGSFVANSNDTWLVYLKDLIANAKHRLSIDAMGYILFEPIQEVESLQPKWTYSDNNSSILYPEITMDHDIYGIPNVVEVIYSTGTGYMYSRVVNNDPHSPTSTISRGREITYRDTNPSVSGNPTQYEIDEYAQRLLKDLSVVEYTISYTHGYNPVNIGDCVRLDYSRAGIHVDKARVISQSINCVPGCPVTEKAVFTTKLWR